MRTISDGLFLTPNAYLVQGWNWFDVVLLALLGVDVFHFRALTSSGGNFFFFPLKNKSIWCQLLIGSIGLPRAFRALRGLRPLRLINQFDGIRSIFTTLIMSFVALGQAVLFSLAVMLPFAIWAVNQFNGLLGSCNDTNIIYIDDCIGEFENTPFLPPLNYTFVSPRMWANPYYYDFDDIAHSMQALFEDISTEVFLYFSLFPLIFSSIFFFFSSLELDNPVLFNARRLLERRAATQGQQSVRGRLFFHSVHAHRRLHAERAVCRCHH